MKIFKFLLSLLATGGLVWALNTSLNIKGAPIPAFGKLLSPFEGFWQNGETLSSKPQDIIIPQLKSNVKVAYDDRLVPHIFADNISDAYYVQGYLHATNRLWQMDFITRAAGGRLSEVLGNRILRGTMTTIDFDKLNRRRGITASAEKTVKEWEKDTETWGLVQSYCAGINSYINELKYKNFPVEYKIFGIAPEAWTPLRMALLAKYMAMDLALGQDDLGMTNAKTLFGGDFDNLYPTYFKEQDPIVPKGTSWGGSAETAKPAMSDSLKSMISFNDFEEARPDPSNGSNNWAVAGSKTKNKKPILCGDPHLGLRLPSIWYEIEISTPDMNVYGVSLPGLPSVIIGFNDHIAWTQTNVGHDVADWYSIKWKDKSRTEYLLDGNFKKADIRIEEIKIKGEPSVMDTVKYSVWGPVVYENDTLPLSNMAFHWVANEVPESSIKTFVKLNKAKNYAEYADAIQDFNVPAQNFAFACKDGDIALKVQGMFPIKAKGQGRFLQDGSLSANNWKGYIPKGQNPQYRNPSRGFVSSANQHSTDPSYPFAYHSENFEPYRGRILNRFLSKSDTFTVEDMMKLQNNNYSLMAEEALPNMIKNLDTISLSPVEKGFLTALQAWNYTYEADMVAPIYFEEWFSAFYEATWDEVSAQKNAKNISLPKMWRTVFLLRDEPNSKYFDVLSTADKKEISKDILTNAFKKLTAKTLQLTEEMKIKYPETPTLTWSHYKDTEVPHISSIPGMGRYHLSNGGYGKALNAVKKDHGPSWRMIVELGDTPRAFVVYPGGQSGNPGSKNYDDFLGKWTKGEYYEAVFMRKADEKNARVTVVQEFKKAK
jgi:penicillin G amidase